MTPAELAHVHSTAMTETRPWNEQDFNDLLAQDSVFVAGDLRSYAVGRVIADEAELLTIVTHPDHRRQGLGQRTLGAFHLAAESRGAIQAFLEVSAENSAATKLYLREGWQKAGIRKLYYHLQDGRKVDAVVMTRALCR